MKFTLQVAFLLCCVVTFHCEGAFVNPNIVTRGGGWGLLEAPFNNTNIDNFIIESGYYGLQQFSQHIKQVFVSDENSIAAISLPDEKLVIVTVNPSNTTEVTQEFDLSLFSSLGSVSLFRTSPTEQHVNLESPSISENKLVTISISPESISTLEVSGVQFSSTANLIQNGNFESLRQENGQLYPTMWEITGYIGNGGGITGTNVWSGRYAGYFEYWMNGGTHMSQRFTISYGSPCRLYLSAWCISSGPSTKLGVTVNNVQGPELTIASSNEGPYASYSFYFSANPYDTVKVYYMNIGPVTNSGRARIDDVVVQSVCG